MEVIIKNGGIQYEHCKDIPNKHLFLGECIGVALTPRGENDNHICIHILGEDDGQWSSGNDFSSYWMDELKQAVDRAIKWMEENADKDPDGYGYKFRY